MDTCTRSFQLTRGEINLETGEFPAKLATNGEASDGHILDVKTLKVAPEIPMFVGHDPSVISQLGRFIKPKKRYTRASKSGKQSLGDAVLHMTGVINLEGDGALAEIRDDVARRIKVGDIKSLSIRWERVAGSKQTLRSDLDKGHYAYSTVNDADSWEPAMFLEGQNTLEASVVGLGSDKAALTGRGQDMNLSEPVREFYAVLTREGRITETTDAEEELTITEALRVLQESRGMHVGDDWVAIDCDSMEGLWVPPDVAARWNERNTQEEASAEQPEPRSVALTDARHESAMREVQAIFARIESPEFADGIYDDAFRAAKAKHLGAVA